MSSAGVCFVLYEKGEHFYRDKGVSIVKFNLEWLLGGKDIKCQELTPNPWTVM